MSVPARAPQAPLENNAKSAATAGQSPRARRYERRTWSWSLSCLKRVRRCGRVRIDTYVGLVKGPDSAGFTGLHTCGSVHACAVCNGKIQGKRAQELGAAMAAWQAQGGSFVFLTLTMRHHAAMRLRDSWRDLMAAWRWVRSHRDWKASAERLGTIGSVRATEVTDGENGWHAHLHCVLFVAGSTTDADAQDLAGKVFGLWSRALARQGAASPLERAQDVRLVHELDGAELAEYLTKTSDLHLELTQTQTKQARSRYGTHPVWTLLDRAADGDQAALKRWHEWERASKGKRALTWSPGLRNALGLNAERSDEDLASDVDGSVECYITPEGWDDILRMPTLIPELLDAVQNLSSEDLRYWLIGNHIDYAEIGEVDGTAGVGT